MTTIYSRLQHDVASFRRWVEKRKRMRRHGKGPRYNVMALEIIAAEAVGKRAYKAHKLLRRQSPRDYGGIARTLGVAIKAWGDRCQILLDERIKKRKEVQ